MNTLQVTNHMSPTKRYKKLSPSQLFLLHVPSLFNEMISHLDFLSGSSVNCYAQQYSQNSANES